MKGDDRERRLVILGCGGHGRVVLDAARASGRFAEVFFCDDDPSRCGGRVCGAEVLPGGLEGAVARGATEFVVAVGENAVRASCWERASRGPLVPAVCVHPTAWVSPFATIGAGTVVLAGAIVQNGAVVGKDGIVNTGAIVEHDARIADHVHLSPGAVLGGGVEIGSGVHVGIGAVVLPGLRIGERAVVGAGAVVRVPVAAQTTVVGVPARPMRVRPEGG